MKKILAFCLALLLTGCLQACVSEQGVPVPGKTTPEAEQAAPGTEEEIPEMTRAILGEIIVDGDVLTVRFLDGSEARVNVS